MTEPTVPTLPPVAQQPPADPITVQSRVDRCPMCGAVVRPGSPWCTLCYADLRSPAPAEPVEHVDQPVQPELSEAGATADPVAEQADAVQADAVQADAEQAEEPSVCWPCARCGARVPIEESCCCDCGAGFMEGGPTAGGSLARAGAAGGIDTKAQIVIIAVGTVLVAGVLLLAMYIVGAIF